MTCSGDAKSEAFLTTWQTVCGGMQTEPSGATSRETQTLVAQSEAAVQAEPPLQQLPVAVALPLTLSNTIMGVLIG